MLHAGANVEQHLTTKKSVFRVLSYFQFINLILDQHNRHEKHHSVEHVLIFLDSECSFHTTFSFSFSRSISQNYNLVELYDADAAQATSAQMATKTNCFIFQETILESPTCPSQNTHQDQGSSYDILAGHLKSFNELGFLRNSFLLR